MNLAEKIESNETLTAAEHEEFFSVARDLSSS